MENKTPLYKAMAAKRVFDAKTEELAPIIKFVGKEYGLNPLIEEQYIIVEKIILNSVIKN